MRLETILQTVKKTDALYQEKNYGNFLAFEPVTLGGFQLLDLIVMELKSHMTC